MMTDFPRPRLALMVTGALLLVLTPLQAHIWHQGSSHWLVASSGLASLTSSIEDLFGIAAYDAVGRTTILAYLGLLWVSATCFGPLGRRPLSAMQVLFLLALSIAALADIGTYWVAGSHDPAMRSLFFWRMEVPGLAVALGVFFCAGIWTIRRKRARRSDWFAVGGLVLAVLATLLFQYLPHGMLMGLWVSCMGFEGAERPNKGNSQL